MIFYTHACAGEKVYNVLKPVLVEKDKAEERLKVCVCGGGVKGRDGRRIEGAEWSGVKRETFGQGGVGFVGVVLAVGRARGRPGGPLAEQPLPERWWRGVGLAHPSNANERVQESRPSCKSG